MNWREEVKHSIDFTFDLVKNQYKDIMFPCYGGRFYRFYLSRYYEREIYFYLTKDELIYTPSGATFTKIPFSEITNLTIKQKGNRFHIKLPPIENTIFSYMQMIGLLQKKLEI